MKRVLILGAGRSAFALINYLLEQAAVYEWRIAVGDADLPALNRRFADLPHLEKFRFDVAEIQQIEAQIAHSDVVISMLPARFHTLVAKPCLKLGKHLLTASYISDDMKSMHEEAKKKGLLFLNEMGLDPGIDHLSAMKIIHELQAIGANITLFKSYTGGLVAPESDDNPWNYKFSWNPRNVVLAGQGTAQFIRNGQYKYIPYHQLFTRIDEVSIDDYGDFEGYANRDSLKYREVYGLKDIPTMLRGTFRRSGFCKSWNHLVQLGITDDTYSMEGSEQMTYREFINAFLPYDQTMTVEQKMASFIDEPYHGAEMRKLEWLGIFEETPIGLHNASPAQVLQQILEQKWQLAPTDKDMIVMQHIFEYELEGEKHGLASSLIIIGEDGDNTAMAKGVGYPLAIAAKLLLTGKLTLTGVQYPIAKEIYEPVLEELAHLGIVFVEEDREVS